LHLYIKQKFYSLYVTAYHKSGFFDVLNCYNKASKRREITMLEIKNLSVTTYGSYVITYIIIFIYFRKQGHNNARRINQALTQRDHKKQL